MLSYVVFNKHNRKWPTTTTHSEIDRVLIERGGGEGTEPTRTAGKMRPPNYFVPGHYKHAHHHHQTVLVMRSCQGSISTQYVFVYLTRQPVITHFSSLFIKRRDVKYDASFHLPSRGLETGYPKYAATTSWNFLLWPYLPTYTPAAQQKVRQLFGPCWQCMLYWQVGVNLCSAPEKNA